MLRAILGAVVLLGWLSGCAQPMTIKECAQDADCPDGACVSGQCVAVGEGQDCPSACRAYEACSKGSNSCEPRYALELTPENGTVVGTQTVTVTAVLHVQPGFNATFPDHLDFTATAGDGGSGGEFSAPLVMQGVYTTQWTPPGDGTFELTVSYPEEGGPSVMAQVTVNRPPDLSLTVTSATPMAAAGGFIYADPVTPEAWRRDQTASVRIESNALDLDPASVTVVVHGANGGSDLTGLSPVPVTPCMAAYCASVEVPLWKPGLLAFRGDFAVEVTAKDTGGQQGSAMATIPVTRWKWSFTAGTGGLSSPAIGQMGTVYFGTNESSGKVFAVAPEGMEKWENPLGAVMGSPAVGAYNSSTGVERVYVGATNGSSGSALYALGAGGTAASANQCTSGEVSTAIAVLTTKRPEESSPLETAFVLDDDGFLVGLRPGAVGARNCALSSLSASGSRPGASTIAKGSDVYFMDSTTKVQGYSFSGTNWASKSGYTAPSINATVTGLGFSSTGFVVGAAGVTGTGTHMGGVFAFSATDGTGLWKNPDSFSGEPVRNMSIAGGNAVIYGRDAAGSVLTSVALMSNVIQTSTNTTGIAGAPVLGASNILYTASSVGTSGVGEVTAWRADTLAPLWKLSDSVGVVTSSPTIDCARDTAGAITPATYGVLYVPSTNGKLYALVVDSPGLDTTAPWPKYQHDARNTGNPDTALTACPTPTP